MKALPVSFGDVDLCLKMRRVWLCHRLYTVRKIVLSQICGS